MKHNYEVVKFGDLKPGDILVGSHGEVEVDKVFEKHIPKRMYEIEMGNGDIIKTSGNHLWYCETDIDVMNKDEYVKLAKAYFENHNIPEKQKEDYHYQKSDIVKFFGNDVNVILFIQNACDSLGHSSVQPHAILDGKSLTEKDIKSYVEIPLYSYNDLIDFLHITKKAIDGEGYLYFGKVRTTDEIYKIMDAGKEVNIPEIKDVE